MGFVVKWPCPTMSTHIGVPALQRSIDCGSGHCAVSRESTSYDCICYLGGGVNGPSTACHGGHMRATCVLLHGIQASPNNYNLNVNEDFVMVLTSQLIMCFIDGFTSGIKSQSIGNLRIGSAHIYWILDSESEVHSIWDLQSSGHAQPCPAMPQTLVFRHCSALATEVLDTAQCLGHQQVTTIFVFLVGGVKWAMHRHGARVPRWPHVSQWCVTTGDLVFSLPPSFLLTIKSSIVSPFS